MKGPKDGILKASIKDTPIEYRKNFSNSSCMLLISVGQPYHEGEKLSATIELVSKKFKSCTIMLCDTLQKYNLTDYLDEQQAYELSLKNGTEWLERNYMLYSKLAIPYDILRWNDIINDGDFNMSLQEIEKLYHSDTEYQETFSRTIKEYISRIANRKEKICLEKKYADSLIYLKEECAGMLIWAKMGFNFEIYPNKRAEILASTFKLLIEPFYNNILIPGSLRFKRYSKNTADFLDLTKLGNTLK
jgi:hypothetical protein